MFLEAAAQGLPVIGGSRDGSVDALADGSIGTPIEPDDQAALTDAIVAGLERRSSPSLGSLGTLFVEELQYRDVNDLVEWLLARAPTISEPWSRI